jgi:hypothetical protein
MTLFFFLFSFPGEVLYQLVVGMFLYAARENPSTYAPRNDDQGFGCESAAGEGDR